MFFEGERQCEQKLISTKHAQHAIELMGEFHCLSGIAARAGQRRQSDGVIAESYGVIGGNDALILQAEAAGEIEASGQAAKVGSRVGGGTGEALVIVGAEGGEDGVGLFKSGGVGEAEFADQTILTGAPGALDTALSLGRMSGDLFDAELIESASW